MNSINPSAVSARESARQGDGKFGEQGHDVPSETLLKAASLLPESFEMTPDRERILSTLLDPKFGGEYLGYGGEETPEEIAAIINSDFPTGEIEAWNVHAVADALNAPRYENGQVEMHFESSYDGDGTIEGFSAGVWLSDGNYLTQYASWRDISPNGAETGLEAAVQVAENIEYSFNRAFGVAKRHGLMTEDGKQTLDWRHKPLTEPMPAKSVEEHIDENGVFEAVVRVPMDRVIGVDRGSLTYNLAEAQVEGGRPYSLEFEILNVDNENGTVDARVRNNVRDMLALS